MLNDKRRGPGGAVACVLAAMTLGTALVPTGARAQFFWDQPRLSADDAARSAIAHGFRVLSRPVRNDDVYVVDAIDRRGMRERLIVAADSGDILQRSFVDAGRMERRYVDPSIPPGPIPPGRIPNETHDPGLLSRLFGNDDTAEAPPPPAVDRPFVEPERPVRPPRVRRPRLVEQAPGVVRQTPVESEPLAPPTAAPVIPPRAAPPPVVRHAPAQAALPPPAGAAPPPTPSPPAVPSGPVRSISSNPLAIPGSREQDEKAVAKPAPSAGAATAQASKPPPSVRPIPAAVKPPVPTAAPVKDAVPVAPLE